MEEDAGLLPDEELVDDVVEGGAPAVGRGAAGIDDPESCEPWTRWVAATVRFIPSPGKERGTDAEKVKMPTAARDGAQASQLRRSLDLLDRAHEDKGLFLQKTRGELCACRHRMDLLSKQQASVAAEVTQERKSSNMAHLQPSCPRHCARAAVGRLQATSRRLHLELENERDLQSRIKAVGRPGQGPSSSPTASVFIVCCSHYICGGDDPPRYSQATLKATTHIPRSGQPTSRKVVLVRTLGRADWLCHRQVTCCVRDAGITSPPAVGRFTATPRNAMWHLEIKKGQLEDIRKSSHEEAEARDRCLQAHAAQQLRREEEASGKAERNRRLRIRKSLHTQRELGLRHQQLVEDAQKNHRVAVKFLKASLGRVREREQKEELESREHLQRRMEAVLALKNSITANRETLRKFQAWGQAKAERAEQQARAEQQEVLAQGRDAFKHLFHQRRLQELEAQRRAFEEDQKLRKREIVGRILKEEAQEESRREGKRPPAKATALRTLRDQTWSYISAFCEGKATPMAARHSLDSKAATEPLSLLLLKASSESMQTVGATSLEEETLAKPEIPGLWTEDHRQCQVPKEDVDRKPVGGTKMDKDILARTLERLRSGLVHKQVASGRVFKGRPFNSKPERIHFKDFDVGKVYKKKITLINATYTLNYCKLVGVEQHLRDFIHVDFEPPGPLSAGMSYEVLVTFKPMINRDLEGNISFLAQTGGFSVPLKCSAKKCSLSLDKELINFGSYVVGETTSRTITLTNTGGLGTGFRFLPASESLELEDSQSILKLVSIPPAPGQRPWLLPTRSKWEPLPRGNCERGEGGKGHSHQPEPEGRPRPHLWSPASETAGRCPLQYTVMGGGQGRRGHHPYEASPEDLQSSLYTSEDRNLDEKTTVSVSDMLLGASTSSLPDSQSRKESVKLEASVARRPGASSSSLSASPRVAGTTLGFPVNHLLPGAPYQPEPQWQCHPMPHAPVQAPELEGAPAASGMVTVPSEAQAEITLGEVTEGEIGPFSFIKVPVIFTPAVPGEVRARFQVVFQNPQCPTLYFRATGVAVDVPVWVPNPDVDLKICMYDRLYQDSVLVHTRSKVALRLRFEVCKELRGHLELLPEMGYIQALASCSVQLKFLPRQSLPEDAPNYFDKDSRVLEAPVTIWVADQTKPVGFTVHAIVTTSDLELRPSAVDFGYCTIYAAVRARVSLCNHSLLPQEFGFVGLPKFVDIQPNDGFGTVLPLETLQLDVLFQPTKAKEYSFQLVCKSEINRCFKLSCQAVGVHPPLELSHYQIKFAATALYDTSVASLYVTNSHVNMSSPPRGVSSGDLCPVGPTSFEFLLPPDAPITISPLVGTVLPGKRCLVRVAFQPTLPHQLISQEALQTSNKETQAKPKDAAIQRKDMRVRDWLGQTSALQKQELEARADEYQAAQATLARTFQGRFDKFVVPCVVASGDVKDRNGLEPLSFSPHNTLYLELWCPAVAPAIVVTSDKGKTVINFGDIAVGHRSIKKVSLQNICPEDLALDFSVLKPGGPFFLVTTPSKLCAGKTRVLVLSFSPHESVLSQETLEVVTKRGTLTLTLVGTGVASMITCSLDGDILDMGYVLARESVSTGFKLQNDSSLPIKFSVRLDSLSRSRASDRQELPQFLTSQPQRADVVGTQNHSGQSVFSVVPVTGILDPGRVQDFTVTFSPDHESLYFSDRLQVVLFGKKVSHQIRLKGAAREHMMFVEGGDPLDVPVESLTVIPASDPKHREEVEELKPVLLTLNYVQLDTGQPSPPATRELQVGCIRTMQPSLKKTVEFSLDGVTWLQHRGFSIEPVRGSVDRGQTKTISVSWVPPADFDPDQPLMVSTLLQLRGDVKENYKVIFVAHVVTGL
ncbi:cilia- and flagella-associated protein 74 [Erethizon dorsatum]